MLRVGLYARVSTHDQQTLSLQMRAMHEYAARRGWTIAVRSERSVPAHPRVNCVKICWRLLAAAKSMWCWSGGWTDGAGRSSIWSSR